jgi:UDP-hydrolysing UDP-N-acetyl-D-glucosamine 2-epimerase
LSRKVAIITGTRAEFGLLRPVMRAVQRHKDLELLVIASGTHLILPAETFREVKASFPIAAIVPMQLAGKTGRGEDVEALARGIGRFNREFERLRPDWVVVLGDRIEPFAATAAAAVGGYAIAHVHGGDRAEGVADESMRHAITKLAHLHLPATRESADRIIKMGERPDRVHVVGSPAIDELQGIEPLGDVAISAFRAEIGAQPAPGPWHPSVVFLMHPIGRPNEIEEAGAAQVLEGLKGERILALQPNFDAGRDGLVRAIESSGVPSRSHLPREAFVGLLKRLASTKGVLVGNSSAGLIEAAALKVPVVDIGPRQGGRERCANVVHTDSERAQSVRDAVHQARSLDLSALAHPYGSGDAGVRIADLLATTNPHEPGALRKRNTY